MLCAQHQKKKRTGQREMLGYNTVSRMASANPIRHSEAGMTSLALSCVRARAGLLYPSTVQPLVVGFLGRGNGLIQVTFFGRSNSQRLTTESYLPAEML